MTTINVTIGEAAGLLKRIEAGLIDAVLKGGRLDMGSTLEKTRIELSKEGKKPTYPIRWDSARQRRAFFATNGFGRGIPTVRTGKYRLAWIVRKTKSGFELSNDTPYSKWVGGDANGKWQSRIHTGRWIVAKDAIDQAVESVPKTLPAAILAAGKALVRNFSK